MTTATEKHTLTPKLRFPEFRDAGWEESHLGELTSIVRGGSPRPIDDFLTSAADGLNWLKIGDVDQDAKYITSTEEKVRAEALSKTRVIQPGDFILSNSMSFGRPYISKIQTCIHDGWIAVTKIPASLNSDFLYYALLSRRSQKYFLDQAAGSGVQNLNKDIIKTLVLGFPEVKEQQKIADCLASLDDLISLEAKKLDAIKAHKKGLMQQLFPAEGETLPKLRFPEFRNAGGWTLKPLGKILSVGNGRDHKHLPDGDIPVYGSGGYMRRVNDYLYDGESVCIGRKGTIDKPVLLSGKFWTVDTLFYTHSFRDVFPKFVYVLFQNIEWLKHNEAGGVPSLSKTNIEKIKVAIPKEDEQQKIIDCLSFLDNLISVRTQKLENLKFHKKGLMQQLFPAIDEVQE